MNAVVIQPISAQLGVPVVLRSVGSGQPLSGTPDLRTVIEGPYTMTQSAPLISPPGAVQFRMNCDRTPIIGALDNFAVNFGWDISLDGGQTFGGCFVDKTKEQPRCYSLSDRATTGGYGVPRGLSIKDSCAQWIVLPPDQGSGIIVRPTYGAKTPVDTGFSVAFE